VEMEVTSSKFWSIKQNGFFVNSMNLHSKFDYSQVVLSATLYIRHLGIYKNYYFLANYLLG